MFKNNILGIWVKNIGEDIILNIYPIIGKINGEKVDIPSTINVIYKNEEICFELDNTQCAEDDTIEIELVVAMENVAGINYKQKLNIAAVKSDEEKGTYWVKEFNTSIDFS